MKRLTLDIDNETHRRLRMQAAATGLTMADLGRVLIGEYLDANEQEQSRVHDLAGQQRAVS